MSDATIGDTTNSFNSGILLICSLQQKILLYTA